MFFQNIYEKGLAQASYMIGCQATGTAVVIDPKRDIHTYLKLAERENLKITHVTETHIHADFLSGSRELVQKTGAEILLSDEGGIDWQYQFPHKGLRDRDVFIVGNIKFEVLHTPGHTPEHISFLVTDTPAGDHPIMILTGDFMFVGDVGRPDLLEKAAGIIGTQESGARQLFESLKKFKTLADHIQVWPGHGAGSACGKALGAVPSTTVGYARLTNWALQYDDEEKFVKTLLTGQPEPPKYFAMMKKLNKIDRPVLAELPIPPKLGFKEFDEALQNGMTVIDTRDKAEFFRAHIPGSVNIQDKIFFSNWAGWLLDYDKPFVLIAAENRITELNKALIRIGLDDIYGYLPNIDDWIEAAKPVTTINEISPIELKAALPENNLQIIDVRGATEFKAGHIPNAINIHGGYLTEHLEQLPQDKTLVLQCVGGDRSSIACSLLKKNGLKNILNLTGGINAWIDTGFEIQNDSTECNK